MSPKLDSYLNPRNVNFRETEFNFMGQKSLPYGKIIDSKKH